MYTYLFDKQAEAKPFKKTSKAKTLPKTLYSTFNINLQLSK